MIIRDEEEHDQAVVRSVNISAFETPSEANLVDALALSRLSFLGTPNSIPALASGRPPDLVSIPNTMSLRMRLWRWSYFQMPWTKSRAR